MMPSPEVAIPTLPLIIDKLSTYQPLLLDETPHSAAVMVLLLVDLSNEINIIITKRAPTLPTYAGHYSFPGGMRDATDQNLYATAEREVLEELNIPASAYQKIGELDDFLDHSGNLVRPFVAVMDKANFEKIHNVCTDEIAEIYYFSLAKLELIKDDPTHHAITRRRPSYAFTEGQVLVWGLTAAILVHFLNVIAGTRKQLGKKI